MLTGSTGHNWSLCPLLAKAGKITRCPLWGHFRLDQTGHGGAAVLCTRYDDKVGKWLGLGRMLKRMCAVGTCDVSYVEIKY